MKRPVLLVVAIVGLCASVRTGLCGTRLSAGQSFIVPAGTVFEIVNTVPETIEVHCVAFLPPGQKLTSEEQPANC